MMEANAWKHQNTLINALSEGRELAKQLRNQINPITSSETCEFLLERVLSSYENAFSLLNLKAFRGENLPAAALLESPHPLSNPGPRNEGNSKDQCLNNLFKKRKLMHEWSEQVKVCSDTGVECRHEDGYSWRKYGQKDILGANFPRAYYRCTHRNTRGCLATKQVQRSDKDPSIFEVTYKGRHSCKQAFPLTSMMLSVPTESAEQHKDQVQQKREHASSRRGDDVLFASPPIYKDEVGQHFPSFSFPPVPIESNHLESQFLIEQVDLFDSYSPLLSTSTSESNHFQLSPPQDRVNCFGIGCNVENLEVNMISNPSSITDYRFDDLEYAIDQIDFGISFDTLECFSQEKHVL